MEEFVIAVNPDPSSSLPFLLRLPLESGPIVLKARETWPRTSKVFCHPSDDWPRNPEIVERVPVRSCVQRGAAIDLVLDRSRENRSQFVFTRARGRQMVFWQSARTRKQARPNITLPKARASGVAEFEIIVDTSERYAWNFSQQQATTTKRRLPAGDYGVELDGAIIAAVERKSLSDLASTIIGGKLWYLLADLETVPRSALVVEDRYSQVFKLDYIRPSAMADQVAEAGIRYPSVPIIWGENRALAQEWTYRFLGAAIAERRRSDGADQLVDQLPVAKYPVPAPEPTTADVRAWARESGLDVPDRGRLRPEIWAMYEDARTRETSP